MHSADTVTVTIPAAMAWRLKNACSDSACTWHSLWQDAMDGKRSDLDAESCSRMSRKAWELLQILKDQGL